MRSKKLFYFMIVSMLAACGGKGSSGNQNSGQETSGSDEISEALVVKLPVTEISENTKALENQAGNTYHAKNMFDGDPATGWSIKLSKTQPESDKIYGPSMNINAKKLAYVKIMNGYGKSPEIFKKNTRAKWIEIYRESGNEFPEPEDIIYSGPLKDTMTPQTLEIKDRFDNSRPTGRVQIRFKGYYPGYPDDGYYMGSKWDDLVISELEFYGIPAN